MTLFKLVEARNALPLGNVSASAKTKYKVARFIVASQNDFDYYTTEYTKLVNECAERDESGKIEMKPSGEIAISQDKASEFLSKTKELNEVEVDTVLPKFSVEEIDELGLSVGATLKLFDFIEEE